MLALRCNDNVTLHNDVTPFATGGSHWLTPYKPTAAQDIHAAALADPRDRKWLDHAAVRLLPQRKLARFSFGQQATVDSPSPRG